jgi:exodeoxyribonuclease V beta subunit
MTRTHPRPPILDRIPAGGHVVLEASAGTGKTFTLEHIVADILLTGRARLEEILVMTFTDKATQEMTARIRSLLERISTGQGASEPSEKHWTLGPAEEQRLDAALAAFDAAPISTIHSFCRRTLAEYAFDSGNLLRETPANREEVRHTAFWQALRESLAHPDTRWLQERALAQRGADAHQKEIVDLLDVRAVLMPEAATLEEMTGHLRSLPTAARWATLNDDVKKHTRKRPDQAFGEGMLALARLGERARKKETLRELLPELCVISSSYVGSKPLLKFVEEALAHKDVGNVPNFAVHGPALKALLSYDVRIAATLQLIPLVQRKVAALKEAQAVYDFDDLLTRTGAAVAHRPKVRAALQKRYRFVLVDEFQDTDEIQWGMIDAAFFDAAGTTRVFLIGDPKQSIYRFRQADIQEYLRAHAKVLDQKGTVVPLDVNHRSSPRLVEFQNTFFQDFFHGGIKHHVITAAKQTLAVKDASNAEVPPVVLLRAQAADVCGIQRVRRATHQAFANEIASLLGPRSNLRVPGGKDGWRPPRASDVMVLLPRNHDVEDMGECLRACGVPFSVFRQEGLFQTHEARDLARLLNALRDPSDVGARCGAWLTDYFGVALADIPAAAAATPSHPLYARLVQWANLAHQRDFSTLHKAVVQDGGLANRLLLLRNSHRELTNHQHLWELLLEEAGHRALSLEGLCHWLRDRISDEKSENEQNVQRLETDADAVQLLTQHKAKGLEAAVVFVSPGLSDWSQENVSHEGGRRVKWLDGRNKLESAREEAEERQRLLYVAMTRARVRLYLAEIPDEVHRTHGAAALLRDRLAAIKADTLATLVEVRPFSVDSPAPLRLVNLSTENAPAGDAVNGAAVDFPAMRQAHKGPFVTSYSVIKNRFSGGYHAQEETDLAEPAVPALSTEAASPEDLLRPGALMGNFLHKALELLDYDVAWQHGDAVSWAAVPSVEAAFSRARAEFYVRLDQVPLAQALLHRVLTCPLTLGGVPLKNGLASLQQQAREMGMLYPIPEADQPWTGQVAGTRFRVGKGYITGVLDMVATIQGKLHVLDWKSDQLSNYLPETLKAHVDENYRTQAALYTLGAVRMLRLRDQAAYEQHFGGIGYCFLRGIMGLETGIHHERPSWQQVLDWEESMHGATANWFSHGKVMP